MAVVEDKISIEELLGYCKALTDVGGLEFDVVNKKVLVIAGTNDLSDWAVNLNINKVKGYHEGFYKLASKLPVKSNIKLVTGYSLGGAVAHIYSLLFNVRCVTFNAARCLAEQPKTKSKLITRFSIEKDFITKCPIGFYHPWAKSYEFQGSFTNPHSIDNFMVCISNARIMSKFTAD